jgi:hypothetical protein
MSANSPGQPKVHPTLNGRLTVDLNLSRLGTPGHQSKRRRFASLTYILYLLSCTLIPAPSAWAAFLGAYSLSSFTLTNHDGVGGLSGTDGSVMSPDGGLSIILTGGNSGSGLGGMTDLVINAAAFGLVRFQYSYSTLDTPGNDFAGYLLGNIFFQLSAADGDCNGGPCPGMAQFPVTMDESFGFRLETVDNQGEPGILTISDFGVSSGSIDTPEPGTGPVVLGLLAAFLGKRWRLSKRGDWGNA